MEDSALIPSPALFDYAVGAMLRIFPDGKFELIAGGLFSGGGTISVHELINIGQQLQTAVADLALIPTFATDSTPITEEDLRPLAELSNYAYQRIFPHPDAETIIQGLPAGSSIEIVSEDVNFPWQLLYPADINAPIDITQFWGMQHILTHILKDKQGRRGPLVPPHIPTSEGPHVGLLTDHTLPAVAAAEIPFFQTLHQASRIRLTHLDPLNPADKSQGLKTFCNFWRHPFHIAHFACHMDYNHNGPNLSEITISDDFIITLQDMVTRRVQINSNPLVIMNACEANNLNPRYSSYFAAWFLDHGARGVIVTEGEVPDTFAAAFAEELYRHLLVGEPAGRSLLATRQHFWHQQNNPSGLLYAMYGPSMIQFKQTPKGDTL